MQKLLTIENFDLSSLLIYGHGNAFHTFKNFVLDKCNNYNIKYFVDEKYKFNFSKDGRYIDASQINKEEADNLTAIICVGNNDEILSIKRNLINYGFSKIILPTDFIEYHAAYDSSSIGKIQEDFENYKIEIDYAYSLLKDIDSKLIFKEFIQIFKTLEHPNLKKSIKDHEYIEKDLNFFASNKEIHLGDINFAFTDKMHDEMIPNKLIKPILSDTALI
jgi:hypothetical protein